ncbi:MAG: DHA2 family efflux MFS transporter permease subunit [Chloroflexota bacterium]|nr:DHA2 family efflux MFS transporter permease subunit [Chloroflexota bacterium]MDE2894039.1 DHA2 family efflux MFS transporter permease subunit [Chloroflexota bacterium]
MPQGGPPAGTPGMPGMGEVPPGWLLPQRRKVLIMVCVMLALFLAALDQTIWSVAAPKAVGDLGGLDLFAWPATSYLLGSTVIVPIIGKLSDAHGRKPYLLAGIVIFLIASALCGASGSMWELIGFRLLQGFGAAFIMANAFTTMGDYFAPAERGRWAGIIAGTFALASIIGPLAGGVLTDELSWRWVFYINIPVGGLGLVAITMLMPRQKPQHPQRQPTDWLGAGMLIVAATPLLLALSMGGNQFGWLDSPIVVCFIVAVVAAFAWWRTARRKGDDGIMPLPMFQNRLYMFCTVVMFLIGIAMMGAMFNLPFFLQGAQGISATNSGLVTLPMSIGVVPASVITGQILARTGRYKPLAIVGGAGATFSLFMLSQLNVDSDLNMARLYMFVMGASMGTLMPLYSLLMQNSLPFRLLGAGTATNQFFRQMGAAMGISLFGAMIVSGFSSQLTKAFPVGFEQLKERPEVLLNPEALQGFRQQLEQQSAGSADAVIQTAREALAVPVTDVFLYGAIVMAIVLAIAAILPRVRFQTQEEMMAAARAAAAANRPPGSAGSPPAGPRPGMPVPSAGHSPTGLPTEPAQPPRVAAAAPSPAETVSDNGESPSRQLNESVPLIASWANQRPNQIETLD